MTIHRFCLNCGCGVIGKDDVNCPVCNKPLMPAEKSADVPFGEKAPADAQSVSEPAKPEEAKPEVAQVQQEETKA